MNFIKKITLLTCCLLMTACNVAGFSLFGFNSAPRVYKEQVPVDIIDEYTFASFSALFPSDLKQRGIVRQADGRMTPGGVFSSRDYRPADYANELRNRLDIRSFPSLLGDEDTSMAELHTNKKWFCLNRDHYGFSADSNNLSCSYQLFATLDWNNNGARDWLVLLTQTPRANENLHVSYWLLISDPQPGGLLSAAMLGMEETQGLGKAKFHNPADARKRLEQLRHQLQNNRAGKS